MSNYSRATRSFTARCESRFSVSQTGVSATPSYVLMVTDPCASNRRGPIHAKTWDSFKGGIASRFGTLCSFTRSRPSRLASTASRPSACSIFACSNALRGGQLAAACLHMRRSRLTTIWHPDVAPLGLDRENRNHEAQSSPLRAATNPVLRFLYMTICTRRSLRERGLLGRAHRTG